MSQVPVTSRDGQSPTAAISNLAVRLVSQYTGRGPTKARTYLHDDLVTVVLQDILTKGEATLVAYGRHEVVLETRRHYQAAMAEELTRGVEEILGRQVVALLSANHIDPDVAIESLMLAPEAPAVR